MTTVISLGGSIIAPEWADVSTIARFRSLIEDYLRSSGKRRVVLVVGGGGPARRYQKAYRELTDSPSDEAQDWIGIMATRLNAELVRAAFGELCVNPVVNDPSSKVAFDGRVLVAAGWKPGFSTDYDAVVLAEQFGAGRIINISNIEQVYSADPRVDPGAKALDALSWSEYRDMIDEGWVPGKNLPFDPVATRRAAELDMELLFVGGGDMENIGKVLEGREFFGSRIAHDVQGPV